MGAGNTVMADEGIGPRCVEALQEWFDFDEQTTIVDVGTMGLLILDILREHDHVIVIDAAQETGHPAGTVVLYTPEDLAQHQVLHSAHDMRLVDVLKAAKLTGIESKSFVIVGVQIQDMTQWVLELTSAVEAAIPVACACVLQQLRQLDVTFTPKPDAAIPAELYDALKNYSLCS